MFGNHQGVVHRHAYAALIPHTMLRVIYPCVAALCVLRASLAIECTCVAVNAAVCTGALASISSVELLPR